jgi:hypothetical protein
VDRVVNLDRKDSIVVEIVVLSVVFSALAVFHLAVQLWAGDTASQDSRRYA